MLGLWTSAWLNTSSRGPYTSIRLNCWVHWDPNIWSPSEIIGPPNFNTTYCDRTLRPTVYCPSQRKKRLKLRLPLYYSQAYSAYVMENNSLRRKQELEVACCKLASVSNSLFKQSLLIAFQHWSINNCFSLHTQVIQLTDIRASSGYLVRLCLCEPNYDY